MYIAIDVGGTNIRIAGSDSLENPDFSEIIKVKVNNNYSEDLKILENAIEDFGDDIEGIGIGLPFMEIDAYKSSGISTNLSDWSHKPIQKDIENALNSKVILENDAACAAFGEAMYGNGIGKNFLFIIWGTGVGGTEIKNDGKDIQYFPIEPGHEIILDGQNGPIGTCGHKGCLESYVGGGSVRKYYGKEMTDLNEKELDKVTDYFAKGLIKLLEQRPADLIIFGGGAAINLPNAVKDIEEKVNGPKMIVSHLGDNAGLYGALALIKMNSEKQLS